MKQEIQCILKRYPHAGRDKLIPILQDVQEALGFISKESVVQIGEHLHLPASKIFGVATFYNQFRFEPVGRYHIQICRGTACHVKGSAAVLETIKRALKIESGQTTRDGMFSLEEVACLGACGLAPVIAVNGRFHAKITPEDIQGLLNTYRQKGESSDE
ncbi:NADH-quinone oxidoreductase subunit NuoE [bacterium]|nr:NADH-quinone oxidoreductase subunit NuoE [candidate division CSSED10-310 bacterium]